MIEEGKLRVKWRFIIFIILPKLSEKSE